MKGHVGGFVLFRRDDRLHVGPLVARERGDDAGVSFAVSCGFGREGQGCAFVVRGFGCGQRWHDVRRFCLVMGTAALCGIGRFFCRSGLRHPDRRVSFGVALQAVST